MNDLYYNIIIIVLVLVLFLAYILIAYFYNSYNNYKEDVDDNFDRTKNYINSTMTKIDTNIRTSVNENNNKITNTCNYINDINSKVNRLDLRTNDNYDTLNRNINSANSNINNTNINLNTTNSNLLNNQINLNKFDTNLKQFFQYKSNGTTINDAIFNYQFGVGVSSNFSLDLLRSVNAISGMTVQTDNTNNFRLCDKSSNQNCMDMSIDNQGLNIFPTSSTLNSNNTTNNIYIYDKTKTNIIAKFDLANKGIYLGGGGENAGMYIKDSNVYIKKLNVINNDSYANITNFNKTLKGQPQTYTSYPFDFTDINYQTQITGIYSIIRGQGTTAPIQNILIINFKSSDNLQIGQRLSFDIPELNNPDTNYSITTIEQYPANLVGSVILDPAKITITTLSKIDKNISYRIKITSDKLTINTLFTEPVITNIINYRL